MCVFLTYDEIKQIIDYNQRMETLAHRIKELRKEKKLQQEDVAAHLGISRFSVSNWENEKALPPVEMIIKMCQLYSVTSDYLLGVSDIRQPDPTADIPEPARSVIRSCIEHLKK